MKHLLTALGVAALCGSAAMAQELPRFNPEARFKVIAYDSGETMVESQGRYFMCELVAEEDAPEPYEVLTNCFPILTQAQAGAFKRVEEAASAEQFVEFVRGLPLPAKVVVARDLLRDMGCRVEMKSGGELAFLRELSRAFAEHAGYKGPISDDLAREISRATDDAGEALLEMGDVTFDEKTKTVTLKDCK